MEKAYDFKALAKNLSLDGRQLTEEAAKSIIEGVFDWLSESAKLSKTPIDDLFAVMYPLAKAEALKHADKIDGEQG